jgi:hypothetical protein
VKSSQETGVQGTKISVLLPLLACNMTSKSKICESATSESASKRLGVEQWVDNVGQKQIAEDSEHAYGLRFDKTVGHLNAAVHDNLQLRTASEEGPTSGAVGRSKYCMTSLSTEVITDQ